MFDNEELRIYQQMIMCVDTPAYMQRARNVEAGWNAVVSRCRRQRNEWLEIPRMRLGRLNRLLQSDWMRFAVFGGDDADDLRQLLVEWKPQLQAEVDPARTVRQIITAGTQLITSFERFNDRWQAFMNEVDLSEVNELRNGYNDFYVLEKECVVASTQVASWGFEPLPPATKEDLWKLFPLVPVPTLQRTHS